MPRKATVEEIDPTQDRSRLIDDIVETMKRRAASKKDGNVVTLRRAGVEEPRSEIKEVIPTGLDVLDRHIIGIGGLPIGRVVEMFSAESAGKSSLLLRWMGETQQRGGIAVMAETEQSLTREWAEIHGVDYDDLLLCEADTLEIATESLLDTIASIPPDAGPVLAGLDSIAAAPTKREIEEGLTGKDRVGERAKILSKFCRLLPKLLRERRVCAVMINQIRDKPGVMFGDSTTTPGGWAVKFIAAVRLSILGGKAVKDDSGGHDGKDVVVVAVKNKLAPPFRKARLRINFHGGWDDRWSTINFAKEQGLLKGRTAVSDKLHAAAREALGWTQQADE